MKKKKFKFNVDFFLNELSSVPFVNGVLFSKIRLLDGGSFNEVSSREEVHNNSVKWRKNFHFPCKLTASATNGVLDVCRCRVSVRKEAKGGKSYVKLGFVDINLAEFAGPGAMKRRYILEGYDDKTSRQDNSILEVSISMQLILGDPLFKVPGTPHLHHAVSTETEENRAPQNKASSMSSCEASTEDNTSIKESQSSNNSAESQGAGSGIPGGPKVPFIPGHARSSSEPPLVGHVRSSSLHSRISGYSTSHSISSSIEGHRRIPSLPSTSNQVHSSSEDTGICDSEQTLSSSLVNKKISSPQHSWKKSSDDKKGNDDIVEQILMEQDLRSDELGGGETEISLHFDFDGKLSSRANNPVPDYVDKYKTL
ncbi:protein FAM102B-like isoform X2 [Actinia tenebrosa]|uniref:Protein FAM102B-like isoform X2 n=1 Tax=Actinia tenebrosa TaxID=6105 RepID=A0A6P8JD89_ACTTE|nr:protein FAM102B-like isoform X2 [Actinia tenebrosa]